jgi:hypothetical protein
VFATLSLESAPLILARFQGDFDEDEMKPAPTPAKQAAQNARLWNEPCVCILSSLALALSERHTEPIPSCLLHLRFQHLRQ